MLKVFIFKDGVKNYVGISSAFVHYQKMLLHEYRTFAYYRDAYFSYESINLHNNLHVCMYILY